MSCFLVSPTDIWSRLQTLFGVSDASGWLWPSDVFTAVQVVLDQDYYTSRTNVPTSLCLSVVVPVGVAVDVPVFVDVFVVVDVSVDVAVCVRVPVCVCVNDCVNVCCATYLSTSLCLSVVARNVDNEKRSRGNLWWSIFLRNTSMAFETGVLRMRMNIAGAAENAL